MSLIPYQSLGAVARLAPSPLSSLAITPSALVKAASFLRPVAQLLWQNRESLGETAVAAKRLVGSLLTRSKPAKRKGRRPMTTNTTGPTSYSSSLIPLSSSMVLSNAGFMRQYHTSDGDGVRVIGTLVLGDAVRYGATGGSNNFCISTYNSSLNSPTGGASNVARLVNPFMLVPISDTVWGLNRLTSIADLYSLFRFVHLHLRYIPSLSVTNGNQQSLSAGYNSDPLGMESTYLSTTLGSSVLTADILARAETSIYFPAYVPTDMELNWSSPQFYYCDPQGAGYPDLYTAVADEAELRQSCQGILTFGVNSKASGPAVPFGTWVVDYVVDFKGITQLQLQEASALSQKEKKDLNALLASGWRPESLETPAPISQPAKAPQRRS